MIPDEQRDVMNLVTTQLRDHEGFSSKPYMDTQGFITIGYGWNLTARGLPQHMLDELFEIAKKDSLAHCEKLSFFAELNPIRKAVVINMMYNLGPAGFSKFVRFQRALRMKDYHTAGNEILNSRGAVQTGARYRQLAEMMYTGQMT